MRRGWARAVGLGMIVVGATIAVPGTCRAEVINRIVATIDGDPVTHHEVERFQAEHGDAGGVPRDKVIEALITDRILQKEVKAKGVTVREEDVDAYLTEVKSRNSMTDEQFAAALAQQGLTVDQYRTTVQSELEKSQLVNREIRARVTVSPEDVERYYESHKGEFGGGGQAASVELSAIILRKDDLATAEESEALRKKAAELQEEAKGTWRFGALAEKNTQGPGADDGGKLGTFEHGQLDPAIEEVVFSMEKGDVSDVIETADALYIVRVDDIEGESEGDSELDDETRNKIREKLYEEALTQRFEGWLTKDLRERHQVEVLE
jgi:parvulin-like peptidyl-prolyl isomerase